MAIDDTSSLLSSLRQLMADQNKDLLPSTCSTLINNLLSFVRENVNVQVRISADSIPVYKVTFVNIS